MKKGIALIIDAGHGGNHPDTGAYCTFPSDGKFYQFEDAAGKVIFEAREGVTNRIIASLIAAKAAKAGIPVYQTHHPYADRGLQERVNLANDAGIEFENKGFFPVFLSIHSDAFGMKSRGPSLAPRGASWWTTPGITLADQFAWYLYKNHSRLAGNEIQYRIGKAVPGEVDKEANFYVLKWTDMPAVLFENLFFTNLQDAQLLYSARYQEISANAAVEAVQDFEKFLKEKGEIHG